MICEGFLLLSKLLAQLLEVSREVFSFLYLNFWFKIVLGRFFFLSRTLLLRNKQEVVGYFRGRNAVDGIEPARNLGHAAARKTLGVWNISLLFRIRLYFVAKYLRSYYDLACRKLLINTFVGVEQLHLHFEALSNHIQWNRNLI